MKSAAIIVANYNGVETRYKGTSILKTCLDYLSKTKYGKCKVIVIDNASTDGSADLISNYNVDIIKRKQNVYSFAQINNEAIKYAVKKYDPDYFVLISNDVFAKNSNWLSSLIKVAEKDPKIGIITCKLKYPNGKIQHAGQVVKFSAKNRGRAELDHGQYDKIEEVDASTASFIIIKKSLIKKIGFLDPNFRFGYEDTDYSIRARKAGFKVIYDGKVNLTHLEGFTHTADNKKKKSPDFYFYFFQLNYSYFIFKNYGFFKRIPALLIELGSAVFSIESKDRTRKLSNIRLKNRIPWRIYVSFKAIINGYLMYKEKCLTA